MGKCYDLKVVKDNVDIWIAFCVGRNVQILSSALTGYISFLMKGNINTTRVSTQQGGIVNMK